MAEFVLSSLAKTKYSDAVQRGSTMKKEPPPMTSRALALQQETHASPERPLWLISRRSDFWLACGGASMGLLASLLVLVVQRGMTILATPSPERLLGAPQPLLSCPAFDHPVSPV